MRVSAGDITLRDAGSRDAARLAAWWNDGRLMAHAGFPRGIGTTEKEVRSQIALDRDDTHRLLILEYRQQPIGEMNFRWVEAGKAEIGIKICEENYQERGIGRRALSLLIASLFQMGCREIVLDTNLKNTRAQHVYETLGFICQGVRENCWQDQLGVWQSAVDYSLTPDTFINWLAR